MNGCRKEKANITRKGLIVREILDRENNKIGDIKHYILLTEKEEEKQGKQTLEISGVVVSTGNHSPRPSAIFFQSWSTVSDVSITGGGIMINDYSLHGYRIGTYIMNQIVTWAKKWPDADVRRIKLAEIDAKTDIAKIRRNRFYEQFGISFEFSDDEKRSGSSFPIRASSLNQVSTWESNIEEVNETYFLLQFEKRIYSYDFKIRKAKEINKALSKKLDNIEKQPLRYAIKVLFIRFLYRVAGIL